MVNRNRFNHDRKNAGLQTKCQKIVIALETSLKITGKSLPSLPQFRQRTGFDRANYIIRK